MANSSIREGTAWRRGRLRAGLALGGGGARGIAHIGVLQVLTEEQISIDWVAGTSAGAIIGAMYAARPDPHWIEQRFREFLASDVFAALGTERMARRHSGSDELSPFTRRLTDHVVVNLSLMRQFAISRDKVKAAISFLVPAQNFAELSIPLSICAADAQTGNAIVYESGNLIDAVTNSASIPGVLEADTVDGMIVVDGGITLPLPVAPLQQHVDFVIASEISKRSFPPLNEISIFSLITRAEQITQRSLAQLQAEHADFVIAPDVMDLHWSQFEQFAPLLDNGLRDTRAAIPALRDALSEARSWRGRLNRWLGRQRHRLQVHGKTPDVAVSPEPVEPTKTLPD